MAFRTQGLRDVNAMCDVTLPPPPRLVPSTCHVTCNSSGNSSFPCPFPLPYFPFSFPFSLPLPNSLFLLYSLFLSYFPKLLPYFPLPYPFLPLSSFLPFIRADLHRYWGRDHHPQLLSNSLVPFEELRNQARKYVLIGAGDLDNTVAHFSLSLNTSPIAFWKSTIWFSHFSNLFLKSSVVPTSHWKRFEYSCNDVPVVDPYSLHNLRQL